MCHIFYIGLYYCLKGYLQIIPPIWLYQGAPSVLLSHYSETVYFTEAVYSNPSSPVIIGVDHIAHICKKIKLTVIH